MAPQRFAATRTSPKFVPTGCNKLPGRLTTGAQPARICYTKFRVDDSSLSGPVLRNRQDWLIECQEAFRQRRLGASHESRVWTWHRHFSLTSPT